MQVPVTHTGPFLTQQQVDRLPIGAEIVVTWSGGNGPHLYKVGGGEPHRVALCSRIGIFVGVLSPVGVHPATRVTLPAEAYMTQALNIRDVPADIVWSLRQIAAAEGKTLRELVIETLEKRLEDK